MPFSIERNDLASVSADVIIVAANEDLQITGGVGKAVAQVAGFEKVQEACNAIGHCSTGSAVVTPAFDLPAQAIIHAVGPIWQGGTHNEVASLRSAYDVALSLAAENNASSIALPLLSAGIYGFPADVSLSVAQNAIHDFLDSHDAEIRLVLFDRSALQAGLLTYDRIKEYIDDVYVGEHSDTRQRTRRADDEVTYVAALAAETFGQSPCLSELLSSLDASFSTTLLSLIDAKGMTDAQVYKRANMSRQLFSKIRSDALYKPTKKTVLALAIALELDLDATEDLLRRAGFALSHSNKADIIVEYFITNNQFDIFEINATLYAFDQPLL